MTDRPGAALPAGYVVRPLVRDDAGPLAAAYHRNRDHLAPWDPARSADFYTPEGQRAMVSHQLAQARLGHLAVWVIGHGTEIVGRVALNNIVKGVLCSASVGYWVDHAHTRRGLALAAVEHACEQALAMGLHRVEAGTLLHNTASQRVLVKAGFEHYGTARAFLHIAGAWQDHHLFERILHDGPPASAT